MISAPRIPPATKSDRLRSLLASCHDDPDRFARVILGCPPFDPGKNDSPFWYRQSQASRLVVSHHTTILPQGNSTGKSWWLARLILWFLFTRPDSLIVSTAPSHQQLDAVLWKNIRAALFLSQYPLGGRLRKSPLGLHLGPEWSCLGIATNKTERMAGHHSGNLLVVGDEASGIQPEIYEAMDSLNPSKIVLIGNPLRHDGRFKELYDQAQEQGRDRSIPDAEKVVALRVPSTDSPDIELDRSPRGLASGAWLRRIIRQYGDNSLYVRTHVKALFPEAAQDNLIPIDWLDWAARTENQAARKTHPGGPTRIGADLGEGVGKDNSAIFVRDDLGVREVWAGNTTDLDGVARHYARLCRQYHVEPGNRTYDLSGIGRQFKNRLAGHGITAIGYEGSGSGGRNFTNLRTACAWAAMQRLDPKRVADPKRSIALQAPFHIPQGNWWPALREELSTLRYDQVGNKTRLISKQDHKALLGRSPDFADGFLQTFMGEVARL